MSNLNELYKESGIKPTSVKEQEKKTSKPDRNFYILSFIISTIIFLIIISFLESQNLRKPDSAVRGEAIVTIPLAYLINYLIKKILKAVRRSD